jgi:hypothetical protein
MMQYNKDILDAFNEMFKDEKKDLNEGQIEDARYEIYTAEVETKKDLKKLQSEIGKNLDSDYLEVEAQPMEDGRTKVSVYAKIGEDKIKKVIDDAV